MFKVNNKDTDTLTKIVQMCTMPYTIFAKYFSIYGILKLIVALALKLFSFTKSINTMDAKKCLM